MKTRTTCRFIVRTALTAIAAAGTLTTVADDGNRGENLIANSDFSQPLAAPWSVVPGVERRVTLLPVGTPEQAKAEKEIDRTVAPEPLLSVREYDALERTARPKSMHVTGLLEEELGQVARAAGAYAGEEEPPLAKKIAEKWPIVKTDEWKTDEWYGGRRTVFTFKGHEAWVVEPPAGVNVAKGCPWTWTMQWASDFVPRTSVPWLLARGYRHVTLMQFDERMTEEGLKLSKEFQEYLVNDLGFAPKANLIGLSWGGFFSVRYASTYPEFVNKIYLDAPLLTFEGFKHDSGPWKTREPADGWRNDSEMPVNRAAALAKAGIPILLAYGCSDTVVNPTTNCLAFVKAYEAAGGKNLKKFPRANFTHHPHGFDVGNSEVGCFFYFNNK